MRVGRKKTGSIKTEGRNLNLIPFKGRARIFKPILLLPLRASCFISGNFTQLTNVARPEGISETPSGVIDGGLADINKDCSCVWQRGPSGPWQFRAGSVWSIENTPWMSATGNAYFPGEAASGDSRIQEAKNIFVWGDYRYKVGCEQWRRFEMLN